MNLFGIGFMELIFILVIALLVLGPNKMVDLARSMGKYIRELQQAVSEIPKLVTLEEEQPRLPEQNEDGLHEPLNNQERPPIKDSNSRGSTSR